MKCIYFITTIKGFIPLAATAIIDDQILIAFGVISAASLLICHMHSVSFVLKSEEERKLIAAMLYHDICSYFLQSETAKS